ncbi:MAG: 3-deoxy-7-phosphoheptulonate synthase [Defluviitaleaceae bacterium]|nr:3-deoxy-7-phosphoheptulonate synthase [Defluviitaleaceae bacterium]
MMNIMAKLPSPAELKQTMPLNAASYTAKRAKDDELAQIVAGASDKFLLIVGPCSADDPAAVLEYADRLAKIAQKVQSRIFVVMRVFTAKPRTLCGYMGLVHEPGGIQAARRLHLDVLAKTGLVTADELLYPAIHPYFDDIISYFTIGARTTESQEHRLLASGIAAPVGIKNPISGDLGVLANAVAAAKAGHSFVYNGHEVRSGGNVLSHAILRGGHAPNYHAENLLQLYNAGVNAVVIDTNHGNSGKDHTKQPAIALEILKMRNKSPIIRKMVKGLMIESYIEEGNAAAHGAAYGRSVTDPCLSLADTEKLIMQIADGL